MRRGYRRRSHHSAGVNTLWREVEKRIGKGRPMALIGTGWVATKRGTVLTAAPIDTPSQ